LEGGVSWTLETPGGSMEVHRLGCVFVVEFRQAVSEAEVLLVGHS
jgi:hypothetical protein